MASSAISGGNGEIVSNDAVEPPKAAEQQQKGLSIGQRVRIAMPGGSLDGIEARGTGAGGGYVGSDGLSA